MASDYTGRRGRHPKDCICEKCKMTRKIKEKTKTKTPGRGDDLAVIEPTDSPSYSPPKAAGSSPSPGAPTWEELINEGEAKPNIVPPEMEEENAKIETEKDVEKVDEPRGKTPARISPKLFMFVGNKLANITKIELYRLEKDEAKDLSDSFQELADEMGWRMGPKTGFLILMLIWLIPPTVQYALENKDKIKSFMNKNNEKTKQMTLESG